MSQPTQVPNSTSGRSPLVASNPLDITPATFTPRMVSPSEAAAASGHREGEGGAGTSSADTTTSNTAGTIDGTNNINALNQEEVKTFYLHLRQKHIEVKEYITIGRPQLLQMLQEINTNLDTFKAFA